MARSPARKFLVDGFPRNMENLSVWNEVGNGWWIDGWMDGFFGLVWVVLVYHPFFNQCRSTDHPFPTRTNPNSI